MGAQGVGVMLVRATEIKGHWSSALSPPHYLIPPSIPSAANPPLPRSTLFMVLLNDICCSRLPASPKAENGLMPLVSQVLSHSPAPSLDAQVMLLDEGMNEH